MTNYEQLREIIDKKIHNIKDEQAQRAEDERKKRIEETNKVQIQNDNERRIKSLVVANHPQVKQRALQTLNEVNKEVFNGQAKVTGWRKVEGEKDQEFGRSSEQGIEETWLVDSHHQSTFDQCGIAMPLNRDLVLSFETEEKHWTHGRVDKSRRIGIEDQRYLNVSRGGSLDLGQPTEDVLEKLKDIISSAVEHSY
ncbi:hypothetical protein A2771_04350 [Candidatus Woesebacteria bacterium RIFCSPHIGHO2_01_FULL_38_26b]|uniref:Uncharacterized protein n=1 Tax=Candidatus Woesebacteria bacterium RIFCSPHIGHO2_01_FULL_38_26b TaxID=1802491 RepID=A0A1F7Y0Y6_9BACT|nr:MAG: hypothetical protein A2771_04350 [Candidatus Woesebacteria bacterium RIFCSPHIGHO2_01_FULL_38_26b]